MFLMQQRGKHSAQSLPGLYAHPNLGALAPHTRTLNRHRTPTLRTQADYALAFALALTKSITHPAPAPRTLLSLTTWYSYGRRKLHVCRYYYILVYVPCTMYKKWGIWVRNWQSTRTRTRTHPPRTPHSHSHSHTWVSVPHMCGVRGASAPHLKVRFSNKPGHYWS